jgi:AraC family transcriptional regulator
MSATYQADQVNIVNFKDTQVAAYEHRGDPKLIGDSIRKFIEWRKHNKLPPSVSATFNILYDNPNETDPERFRLDICAATNKEVAENSFGVMMRSIPSGRCAVLRHIGSNDNLPQAVTYLYSEWLPQSGEELRDFPLFFQRVSFFPDVSEHEAVTDVLLPLK